MISTEKIKYGASAELIAHKKNRIVSAILLGFAGLFYGLGTTEHYGVNPSGISLFIYFVSLICLFSACVNVFKDMHDIPSADVQMSMPLSSTERYFSRLLTIFYIWVLPFLISAACGFLLSLMFSPRYDPSDKISLVNHHPTVTIASFNLRILLYYTETVLFVVAAAIICQCCVGSKAESRYMPILLMAVMNYLPVAVYYSVSDKFAYTKSNTLRRLSNMSLLSIFYDDDSAADIIFLIVKCLIYLAVIGLGVLIYKKRDARSVGRPIVFTAFFEVVIGLSLLLFFNMGSVFNPTAMFFAWLGSIILRLIASRKEFAFSKIFLWTGLYILYYIAFLLFMFIAFKTGGFGALYKVPDKADLIESKIGSVQVTIYDDYIYNYHDHNKYSMEKGVNFNSAREMESVDKFLKNVSEEAKLQSKVKGLFTDKMFGTSDNIRAYICTVGLYSTDGRFIYSVSFYIPRSEASRFIEICKGFEID